MKTNRLFLIAALVLILTGCSGKTTKPDDGAAGASGAGGAGSSGVSSGSTGDLSSLGGATGSGGRPPAEDIIYFEFDQSEVQPQYNQILVEHAEYLSAHPDTTVRLEGNTDERGSREYNIGLGERRAQAVKQVLMVQGVSVTQIVTVSYGEERPAMSGDTETAYAKNRRVEIVYQ